MSAIPILSTVVMVATGVTIVLAVASYVLYRLREVRKKRREVRVKKNLQVQQKYFDRYVP
jgi:hypothetical protein